MKTNKTQTTGDAKATTQLLVLGGQLPHGVTFSEEDFTPRVYENFKMALFFNNVQTAKGKLIENYGK